MRLSFPPLKLWLAVLAATLFTASPFAAAQATGILVPPVYPISTTFVPGFITPAPQAGVGEDASGNLYLPEGAMVLEVSGSVSNPTVVDFSAADSGLTDAVALALDAQGDVWVADYSGESIVEFSPAGTVLQTIAAPVAPTAIAIGANGTVYFTGASNVYAIENGTPVSVVTTSPYSTNQVALAVGPQGTLYVADEALGEVFAYAPAGVNRFTPTSTPLLTGLSDVNGAAVDEAGNIYVETANAASGRNIERFSLSGTAMAVIAGAPASGGTNAYGIPEANMNGIAAGSTALTTGPASEVLLTALAANNPKKLSWGASSFAGLTLDKQDRLLLPQASGAVWALPLTANFGSVAVGSSATQYWYFQNTQTAGLQGLFDTLGDPPVAVSTPGTAFAWAGSSVAALGGPACAASGTEESFSGVPYPNAFCELDLTYTAGAVGAQSALLSFSYTDGGANTLSLTLSGTGFGAIPSGAPAATPVPVLSGTPSVVYPQTTAIDPWGNVYVYDEHEATAGIYRVNSDGSTTQVVPSTNIDGSNSYNAGNAGDGLAFDPAGNLYYASGPYVYEAPLTSVTDGIPAFNAPGTAILTAPNGDNMRSLAIDAQGNVYGGDTCTVWSSSYVNGSWSGDTVLAGKTGCVQNETSAPAVGAAAALATSVYLDRVGGLAVDASGNIYLADRGNDTVYKVTDGLISAVAKFGATPWTLAVDAGGNLYIADTTDGVQVIYSPATNPMGPYTLASAPLVAPAGVAVDGAGNLYVTDPLGSGTGLFYKIAPGTAATSLGTVTVGGTPGTATLPIANMGNSPLTWNSPATTDSSDGVFGALAPPTITPAVSNACSGTGTLAGGTACLGEVTFTPTAGISYGLATSAQPNETVGFNFSSDISVAVDVSGTGKGGAASQLVFTTEPGTAYTAGGAITVGVSVETSGGTVVSTDSSSLALTLNSGSFAATPSCSESSGVFTCTFAVDTAGSYTVTASDGTLATATSSGFSIAAGAPALVALASGGGQSAFVSTAFANPATFTVTDAYGNAKGGVTVTLSLPAAGASAAIAGGIATVITNGLGQVTTPTLTANATAGTYNLTATVGTASGVASLTNLAANVTTFPSEPVGTPAPSQAIAFVFPSATTVGSIRVVTGGATGLDFANAGAGTCAAGAPQAAGSSCTVSVAFTPTAVGTRLGAVEVYDANGNLLQTVYVSGLGQGALAAYTGSAVSTYSIPPSVALAFDTAGDLYYPEDATAGGGTLIELTAGTFAAQTPNPSVTFAQAGSGAAFDGAGNLYYCALGTVANSRIYRVPNINGVLQYGQEQVITAITDPHELAVDGAGNVFIVTYNDIGQLYELPSGSISPQLLLSNLGNTQGVVFGTDGNLYFTADSTGKIYRVSNPESASPSLSVAASVGGNPFGLGVDAAGDLYYGDESSGNIYRVSNVDGVLNFASPTLMATVADPRDIVFDSAGSMYIASNLGTLTVIQQATAPALASFGSVGVGATSAAESETLQNIGNLPLNFSAVATAAPFADQGSTCATGTPVAAGTGCAVTAVFQPTAVGPASGSFTLTDNAANESAPQSLALSGTATVGAAAKLVFTAEPGASYTAGGTITVGVTVEDSGGNTVTTNNSTLTLALSPNSFATAPSCSEASGIFTCTFAVGTAGSGYTVSASDGSLTSAPSSSFSVVVGAPAHVNLASGGGQSAFVSTAFANPVVFAVTDDYGNAVAGAPVTVTAPTSGAAASFTAPSMSDGSGLITVTGITANATAGTYNLTATAGTASGVASLTNLPVNVTTFPSEPVGTPAPSQPISFVFSAPTTVTTASVVTQGYTGLDFQGSAAACQGTFAAGQSCTVNVTFDPLAVGARQGAVVLYGAGNGILQAAYLGGLGQGAEIAFANAAQTAYPISQADIQIAVDPKGNIFFVQNGALFEIPNNNGVLGAAQSYSMSVSNGSAAAFDGAGNLYLSGSNTEYKVPVVNGVPQMGALQAYGLGTLPNGIPSCNMNAVDGAGNVFLACPNELVEIPAGTFAPKAIAAYSANNVQSIALDGNDDVYVGQAFSNVLIEVQNAVSANPTVVTYNYSAQSLTPWALGIDPAGDVYFSNGSGTSAQIYELVNSGGTVNYTNPVAVPGAVVAGPRSINFDAYGNMIVSQTITSQSNAITVIAQATAPALASFGNVGVGVTSAAESASLQNIGNEPLNFSAIAAAAPFASQTGTCAVGTPVAPGITCTVAAVFQPTAVEPASGALTLTDNAANETAPQALALSGAGIQGSPGTVTYNPSPTSIAYGTALGAGVLDATISGSVAGNFSYTANGIPVASTTVLPAGTYTLVATYTPTDGIDYATASATFNGFSVGKATLTVSGLAASNTTYNGSTAAALTGTPTLVGVVSGDSVSLAGTPVGTFASANAGTGITVTVSGLSLTGTAAGNYTLTEPTLSANIGAKALTVSGLAASNTTYNGSTAATLTGTPALVGVIGTDNVTLAGTPVGTFASASAGTGIAVTVSGLSLTGPAASNYTLTEPTLSANIAPKALTVGGLSASNLTYNGNTADTITGSGTLLGVVGTDNVTLAGTPVGAFASDGVGTGIAVTVSGLSLSGPAAGNYTLTEPTLTANITAKALTVAGLAASNQTYNGSSVASLTGTGTLVGVVGSDNVTLAGTPVGTFASTNAGTGITVTVSGLSLSGTAASNYILTEPTLTANITAKALTVAGLAASNQTYDGNTAAAITGTGTLVGVVGTDNVTLSGTPAGTFASDGVGTGITVTVSGLSLSGGAAGNYTLTEPTLTANITAKALTVTGLAASNQTYDGSTAAAITGTGTLVGVVGSDNVSLAGTPTGTFASDGVGTGIAVTVSGLSLSGPAAGNYTLTEPTLSANITAATLTVTGLSASNMTYNGGTTATLTGTATLVGVVGSDSVTLGGTPVGTFASDGVGTGIAVTVSGLSLTGPAAGNYTLTEPTLTANITGKALTVTGLSASSQTYNGSTVASITGTGTLVGVVGSDSVSLAGTPTGTFASDGVGTGITVTVTGLSLTGSAAANYILTEPTLSANITAATLTVTGLSASNQTYNGGTTATLTGTATLVGVVNGDSVSLSGTPVGTFASAGVGTGITVTVTGLSLTGPAAGNYTLAEPTLSANITPATVTITWTPALAALTYGATLTPGTAPLNATSGGVNGTFTYVATPAGGGAPITIGPGTVLPAGSYTLTLTFTPTDTTDYTTPAPVSQGPLTVNPAAAGTLSLSGSSLTYGTALGSAQLNAALTGADAGNGTITYAITGTTAGGTPLSETVTAGTIVPAGTYTITATFTPTGATSGDYSAVTATATLAVSPASAGTVTFAPNPATIVAGTPLGSGQLDAILSGAGAGQGSFSYSLPSGDVLAPGSYAITATYTIPGGNYSPATGTATVTVVPKLALPLPATAAYGTAVPLAATGGLGPYSYTVVSGPGTIAGGALSITSGTGTVVVKVVDALGDTVTASLKAAPAVLTVAATSETVTYGAVDPDQCGNVARHLTYTVTGFVNGQSTTLVLTGSPTESTTAQPNSGVGSYPITMAAGSLRLKSAYAGDYTLAYVGGTVTVTPATVTVTATSQSEVYGSQNLDPDSCGRVAPHLNYTVSGLVLGESQGQVLSGAPQITTTATPKSGVGTYPITISAGTLALNRQYAADYTIAYVNGTLTVTPATLTVLADSYSRPVNQANPVFGYTMSGFVNGDTQASAVTGAPTLTTTATTGSPAGNYVIVIGLGSLAARNGNYTFTLVNGELILYNPNNRNDPHCDGNGNYRSNPQYDCANWSDRSSYGYYWSNGGGQGPSVTVCPRQH